MKKTFAAAAVAALSFSAPMAQAQAVPPAPTSLPAALGGAGISAGAAAAALAALVLVAVVAGGDDTPASSTTTSTN